MRCGILAKKVGCSSFFDTDGVRIPVTLVKVTECMISEIKTLEKNGYSALQIVLLNENKKNNFIKKPQKKLFADLNINPSKYIKEFKVDKENILEKGSSLDITFFNKGQFVDVTGTSKGKGFAGAMKRHNFSGLRASHGVSVSHRSHGSTGNSQDPGRVFKGKKMAGRMGNKKVTKQNIKIVDVDQSNNLLVLKGSIPGNKNSIISIKDAIKKKK